MRCDAERIARIVVSTPATKQAGSLPTAKKGSSSPHKTRQNLPFLVAFAPVDLDFDVFQRILVILLLLGHLQLGCILPGRLGPSGIVRVTTAIGLTTRPAMRLPPLLLPVALRLRLAFVRGFVLLLLLPLSR